MEYRGRAPHLLRHRHVDGEPPPARESTNPRPACLPPLRPRPPARALTWLVPSRTQGSVGAKVNLASSKVTVPVVLRDVSQPRSYFPSFTGSVRPLVSFSRVILGTHKGAFRARTTRVSVFFAVYTTYTTYTFLSVLFRGLWRWGTGVRGTSGVMRGNALGAFKSRVNGLLI